MDDTGDGMSDTGDGVCGDGQVDNGEECDLGGDNADNAACTSDCKNATCGDGLVEAGEEDCDDGEESVNCNANCTSAACGDGVHNVTAGEGCDDGNRDNTDACVDMCEPAACGDGYVWAQQESCDGDESCLSTCAWASSCKQLLDDDDSREDGAYMIDPAGDNAPIEVYCDMTTDGGGWTRGMVAHAGDASTCDTAKRWELILDITESWEDGGEVMSKYFSSNTSSEYSSPLSVVKLLPGPYNSIHTMFSFADGTWNTWEYGGSPVFSMMVISGPPYSNGTWWNYSNSLASKANYCIGGGGHQACIYDGSARGRCGQIHHDGTWHTSNVTQELFVREP